MKINLKGTGIVLTDAITDYATKKIGALEKFVDRKLDGVIFRVEVGKTTKHHKGGDVFKAEVNVVGGGLDIYAVAEAEDLYAAIDLVETDVQRELVQGKTRRLKLLRRGQRAIKNLIKDFPWALKRFKRGDK